MLPSVSCNVDVGTNTCEALNTGRGSDVIVLTEAGGFCSRKYGHYTDACLNGEQTLLHAMW